VDPDLVAIRRLPRFQRLISEVSRRNSEGVP